jgi:hypothetical protein
MKCELRNVLTAMILLVVGATLCVGQEAEGKKQAAEAPKQRGKVYVSVLPEESYIFVDGQPLRHRSGTLTLSEGEHTIGIYNYGYEPRIEKVKIAAGKNPKITAHLKAVGKPVSGPWGRIQIEGVPGNALVFLNGTTPEFFVGHADEMNNDFMNVQQLIMPVGKHQLNIVRRKTNKPIFSGPVEVKENKRLIVYVKGEGKEPKLVYKDWSHGATTKDLKRFEAGTATATIVVAPVTGKLVADRTDVKCNEPVKLSWVSDGAGRTTVTAGDQTVGDALTGDTTVQPKQSTKYELRAAGPGGIVTQDATVNVDPTVRVSLVPSATEVRYVKVGDQVQEAGTTDLKWTAENANSVTIDPIGAVQGNSGSHEVKAEPKQSSIGPVDETQTYKITATNECGGSDTKTVAVHVTGSIEGAQVAQAEPPPALPKTASPLPLLSLVGLAALGAGSWLTRRGR